MARGAVCPANGKCAAVVGWRLAHRRNKRKPTGCWRASGAVDPRSRSAALSACQVVGCQVVGCLLAAAPARHTPAACIPRNSFFSSAISSLSRAATSN